MDAFRPSTIQEEQGKTWKVEFSNKTFKFDAGDAQNASPASTNFAKKGRNTTNFIERLFGWKLVCFYALIYFLVLYLK